MRHYRKMAQNMFPFTVDIEFTLSGRERKAHRVTVYAQDRKRAIGEAVKDLALNYQHHHIHITKADIICERNRRNQSASVDQ